MTATLTNTILVKCPGSPGGMVQIIVTRVGVTMEYGEMNGSLFMPYDRDFISFTDEPTLSDVYDFELGAWNADSLFALVTNWCDDTEDGEDE